MITNVSIKNYKSVVDVSLPLGRFNLLIGANGCGKSNILEGITMGAAASSDMLKYEYFSLRGIRAVEPQFMLPAFEDVKAGKMHIEIVDDKGNTSSYIISYNEEAKPPHWEVDSVSINGLIDYLKKQVTEKPSQSAEIVDLIEKIMETQKMVPGILRLKHPVDNKAEIISTNPDLVQFIIYSLEESKLRKADDSNYIYPFGCHGEGLFSFLKKIAQRPEAVNIFNEIKRNLLILDWFDDMEIPSNQLSNEFNIKLKDSYLAETINMFDQRSTNEGFLYLLFYLTLVISDETPNFFAIENIDTAFNPKLCHEVVRRLIKLARKHDKQIIATTHNPAVLDGLDLHDEEQKLMVVQRSVDGYTKVRTLNNKDIVKSDLPLSQLWLRGFIGGLPNNF